MLNLVIVPENILAASKPGMHTILVTFSNGKPGSDTRFMPALQTISKPSFQISLLMLLTPRSENASCMLIPKIAGMQLLAFTKIFRYFIPKISSLMRVGKALSRTTLSMIIFSPGACLKILPIIQLPSKLCTTLPGSR